MTLEEAMGLIGRDTLTPWHLTVPSRAPGETLIEILQRFEYFDLESSEPAKTMLIDALFVEIVPRHKILKVWKEATLITDTTTGVADYIIAPKRAFLAMLISASIRPATSRSTMTTPARRRNPPLDHTRQPIV